MMDEVPKKKTVSGNFSHAVFSLLFIHDNLVMQTLVWLHVVQFRASQFGMVQFGFLSMNLRSPHTFKCHSKRNVYAICRQTQLSTRWYANLLNVNLNYMFRPQSFAIIRLYKE